MEINTFTQGLNESIKAFAIMQRASVVLLLLLLAAHVMADSAAAGTGPCPDGYHCCNGDKNGQCKSPCLKNGKACPQQGGTGGGHIKMRKLKADQAPLVIEAPEMVQLAAAKTEPSTVVPPVLTKKCGKGGCPTPCT